MRIDLRGHGALRARAGRLRRRPLRRGRRRRAAREVGPPRRARRALAGRRRGLVGGPAPPRARGRRLPRGPAAVHGRAGRARAQRRDPDLPDHPRHGRALEGRGRRRRRGRRRLAAAPFGPTGAHGGGGAVRRRPGRARRGAAARWTPACWRAPRTARRSPRPTPPRPSRCRLRAGRRRRQGRGLPHAPRRAPGHLAPRRRRSSASAAPATASTTSATTAATTSRRSRASSPRTPVAASIALDHDQSGYSSLRQARGSSGPGFGDRLRRDEEYGATNGSGADHRVGVVDASVLAGEGDEARALAQAVLELGSDLPPPVLEPSGGSAIIPLTSGMSCACSGEGRARSRRELRLIGRDVGELPTHPLLVGGEPIDRRAREADQRHVAVVQMHARGVELIPQVRASGAGADARSRART